MGFAIGFLFGIVFTGFVFANIHNHSEGTYKLLAAGEEACENFGGLKSHNEVWDFECANGVTITDYEDKK